MKKLIALATIALCISAQAGSLQSVHVTKQGFGTNNLPVFDVSGGTTVYAVASMTGVAERANHGTISVTNLPVANGTLAVVLSGVTNNYTWQTTPVTNYSVLSVSAPLARVGIEATPSAGDTLTIIRSATGVLTNGAFTNVLTWATNVDADTKILIGASAAASATNLYNRLATYGWTLSVPVLSYYKAAGVEFRGQPNELWSVTNSSTWATNLNSTYYQVTNTYPTNSYQIAIGATTNASATNLYTKLVSDYGTNLTLGYASAYSLNIASPQAQTLSVTAAAAWGSASISSNGITGAISLVSSNSVDGVNWFRAANDITLNFSGSSAVVFQTNWTSVAFPYLQFTACNDTTNYAAGQNLTIRVGTK